MLDRAARLARLGTRLVSAPRRAADAGTAGFRRFALWQDAALRRGRLWARSFLQYKPAALAADNRRWPG